MIRLSRRRLGALAAAVPLLGAARHDATDDLTLILMGDLHSGYAWSARLLAAVRAVAGAARGAVRIVVNGDVFEHNNVVARRNQGLIDFALLRAFSGIAPTLVTIGNHDGDLFDPRDFAAGVASAGATLLTDIVDPRSGKLYGAAATRLALRGHRIGIAALGTPVLSLYPAAMRADYQVPVPESYAAQRLPALLGDVDLAVVLVHAGFVADRSVLPHLRAPFLLHGAHDHLRFARAVGAGGGSLHLQSGAWSSAFQVVTVRLASRGPAMQARDVVLAHDAVPDPALQSLIARELQAHLQPPDRVVLGHLPQPLDLDAAVLRAAGWVRAACDVEIALLSHTTFGDGLPAGPVTAYDRASFLRFDGRLAIGEIPAGRLAGLLARTNQLDGHTAYARRTGDYLYASAAYPGPVARPPRDRPVRVAINAYAVSSAANRIALLGWDAAGFELQPAGSPTLGQIIDQGLAAA